MDVSQTGKSILLVDDDEEIRELLQTYLSRAGFQVRTVGDGAGFRQAIQDEVADLVILDVMLPDEDGFSLCRWADAVANQRLPAVSHRDGCVPDDGAQPQLGGPSRNSTPL